MYASAFLHDTIEDARMTYNDVVKFLKEFKGGGFVLPEGVRQHLEDQVPEIVYALTNEKGRNRGERANDLYYQGIRQTKFASFIKMCDRLANIQYTMMFVLRTGCWMFTVKSIRNLSDRSVKVRLHRCRMS